MTGVLTLYRTSIGKKAAMAVTGIVMLGFVFVHMIGNFKLYQGAEVLNEYAVHLRYLGEPILGYDQGLWIARVVLLAAVVIHIVAAVQLTLQSRASRSTSYAENRRAQPIYRYASFTMRWGGITLMLFIIFHLLHFTFGVVGYSAGEFIHPITTPDGTVYSVYHNVVAGFREPIVSLFYIFAMIALGLHIYHGAWSMFQTLGLNSERYDSLWRWLAGGLAVVVTIGNISLPVAVMTGIVS